MAPLLALSTCRLAACLYAKSGKYPLRTDFAELVVNLPFQSSRDTFGKVRLRVYVLILVHLNSPAYYDSVLMAFCFVCFCILDHQRF